MNKPKYIIIRIKIFCFFCLLCFGYLLLHIYNLQIKRHQELYAKARATYTVVKSTLGRRGEIFDYDGNLLVGNIPCVNIIADPQIAGKPKICKKLALYLSAQLSVPYRKIYKKLVRKYTSSGRKIRYAVIAKEVNYEIAKNIKSDIKRLHFKGITLKLITKRYYPKGSLLANILGFTNIDRDKVIAVIGIEKLFNKKMSPGIGELKYERTGDGKLIAFTDKRIKKVKNGLNLYLTIKEPIQSIMEEELDALMKKWRPKAAYAVMADPYTGNILAVAQRPTFNPNNRRTMRNPDAWRIRVIEDIFEPGSTMKPIAISGAVDYGAVAPETKFDCEHGYWVYAGKPLHDAHPMDILTVSEIIQKSSNIGTAKIAIAMGAFKLYKTLKKFGFGQRTGICLRPETKGIFRPLRKWDKLSITRFPIGQGIAVSPLQLVRAYCALANGGYLVKLRIVDRIKNPDNNMVIKMPLAKKKRIFIQETTHRKIIEMMKRVTEPGGTAVKAAIPGYDVAGKTGTSQKWISGEGYSHSRYFATFIGFVPAYRPAFVLLVTADEPKGAHYGGTVAAPTFKNIALRTLKYLNIQPTGLPFPYEIVESSKFSHTY